MVSTQMSGHSFTVTIRKRTVRKAVAGDGSRWVLEAVDLASRTILLHLMSIPKENVAMWVCEVPCTCLCLLVLALILNI